MIVYWLSIKILYSLNATHSSGKLLGSVNDSYSVFVVNSLFLLSEGFQSSMWKGLSFILPFLALGYVCSILSLINARHQLSFPAMCI